mmetsp:Transcript_3858/g.7216  ORF Transcript_3858/g.7216 Transcript_3858/m.7216 type:complete len:109 (-) Transcript_3858:3254-3580(-)
MIEISELGLSPPELVVDAKFTYTEEALFKLREYHKYIDRRFRVEKSEGYCKSFNCLNGKEKCSFYCELKKKKGKAGKFFYQLTQCHPHDRKTIGSGDAPCTTKGDHCV